MDEQRLSQLMRLVAQNLDRAAFSELFDALAPRVKASLMKSGLDSASAEDLLQDVMISIWTKAGLFDPARGSVFAWVFTIARNARIDKARRKKPVTSLDLMHWDPVDESESSEETMVRAENASALHLAMKTISPDQRIIIEMSFVQELTQADIATRLSLPLGTVKSRMRLAYAHLRDALEQ